MSDLWLLTLTLDNGDVIAAPPAAAIERLRGSPHDISEVEVRHDGYLCNSVTAYLAKQFDDGHDPCDVLHNAFLRQVAPHSIGEASCIIWLEDDREACHGSDALLYGCTVYDLANFTTAAFDAWFGHASAIVALLMDDGK